MNPPSFDQIRIDQLLSTYGPVQPPSLPLEFGDYLSLIWRLDHTTPTDRRATYYRRCINSLTNAMGLADKDIGRLIRSTVPGELYNSLENLPYRVLDRAIDAADRQASIRQLLRLRSDIMALGCYAESWQAPWPGSGIIDAELHDRMFAILFTALPGQYAAFSRLLLVTDIVLQELLTGIRRGASVLLFTLVREYGYPDPQLPETVNLFK